MATQHPKSQCRQIVTGNFGSGDADVRYELFLEDAIDHLKSLSDCSVPLVLTDIPYGEVNQPSGGLRELDRGKADVMTFDLRTFIREVIRVTSGSIYVFCGTMQISYLIEELQAADMRMVRNCAWLKPNPSPMNGEHGWLSALENVAFAKRPRAFFGERTAPNYWKYATVPPSRRIHRTQKPTALLERIISASSKPGDLVLDPCMGFGSTGEAALTLGRNFTGIELDQATFLDAARRIEGLGSDE